MLPASDIRSATFCTLCLPKENSPTDDRDSGEPVTAVSVRWTGIEEPTLSNPVNGLRDHASQLAQRGFPRAVQQALLTRTTERLDQLRNHFAAKRLPSGFQIAGA